MAKSGIQKALERQRLFDLYAPNWSEIRKHLNFHDKALDVDDIYVCPICLQPFPRTALLTPQILTLEHIPPKSVGGKDSGWILLCGNCNHTIGSTLDSQLDHRLQVGDFLNKVPSASTEARFTLGEDAWLPSQLKWSDDGHLLIFSDPNPKRSSPNNIAKHNEYTEDIKQAKRNFEGRFSISIGNRSLWEAALLRIAYLMVFRLFGYGALTHSNMLLVRDQIRNPDKNILPRSWLLGRMSFDQDSLGVNIIHEPKELRSFLVVFELATKLSKEQHCVLLPCPKEPGLGIYNRILERPESILGLSLALEAIPYDPRYITNSNLFRFPDTLWDD